MLPEIEMKIYKLIEVCKRTRNYQKLIEVGLKLISVRIRNLAIFLEMENPSFQKVKEIYRQVEIISILYERVYQNEIIDNTKIGKLKIIEQTYKEDPEDIPYRYVSQLYEIYYLLEDVEIPHDGIKEIEPENISFNLDETLDKRIAELNKQLKEGFSKETFSELIQIKLVRDSFKDKEKKQVQVEEALKESPLSSEIFSKQGEYFFVSLIVIILGIGFFLTAELIIFPYLFEALSFLLFLSFGIAALMLLLYWKVFMEKQSQETFLNSGFKL